MSEQVEAEPQGLDIQVGVVLSLSGTLNDSDGQRERLHRFFKEHARRFGYICIDSSRCTLTAEGIQMFQDLVDEFGPYVQALSIDDQLGEYLQPAAE